MDKEKFERLKSKEILVRENEEDVSTTSQYILKLSPDSYKSVDIIRVGRDPIDPYSPVNLTILIGRKKKYATMRNETITIDGVELELYKYYG